MNILLNDNHELRSGWKFIAFVVLFLIFWVISGVAISMIYARSNLPEDQLTFLALNEFALFAAALGALSLSVRFVDRRPLRTFGIGLLPNWRFDLGTGLMLAAAMLVLLLSACYVLGNVNIQWAGGQGAIRTIFDTFGLLLLAAATEELVFRGFPLQILVEGMGKWPAVMMMSALFGATHLSNPGASLLSALNTAIAGILLSLAFVKSRSLLLPYGIHAGWNLGLGVILGFPLSGLHLASLWTIRVTGNDKILGGGYGPEGGLLATFIFASSAVFINRRPHRPGELEGEAR